MEEEESREGLMLSSFFAIGIDRFDKLGYNIYMIIIHQSDIDLVVECSR